MRPMLFLEVRIPIKAGHGRPSNDDILKYWELLAEIISKSFEGAGSVQLHFSNTAGKPITRRVKGIPPVWG